MHSFTSHVKTHIALWENEGEDEEVVCCSWIGCDFSCSDSHEYVCHVLFHPYHSYLKLLGSELQNKKGLPSCQLDGDMQNVVPQLEVELRCQWEESKCGRRFESVGEFYTHIHNHAMSERSMCCRWKGESQFVYIWCVRLTSAYFQFYHFSRNTVRILRIANVTFASDYRVR